MKALWLIGLVSVLACGDANGDRRTEESESPASKPGDAGADADASEQPEGTPLPQGTFLVGVAVAPLNGLTLPYQLEVEGTTLRLRALSTDGKNVSDVLAENAPVSADAEGAFEASFDDVHIPGEFTPTGGLIVVHFRFKGQVTGQTFCGTLSGAIGESFDLAGSTFAAVPWEGTLDGLRSACEPERKPVERLTKCPTMSPGETKDFVSGGTERTLELVLPGDYDAEQTYPLLFVFHGFEGTPKTMLDERGLRPFADARQMIFVAPQGQRSGDDPRASWDTFNPAAYNADIALVDDLVKCITEQYTIDEARIYATGMSFGGLMTGALIAQRGDLFAAAAPFSGGITLPCEARTRELPVLATWGGPDDLSNEQDFDQLARSMLEVLGERGHFRIACNHGLGHELHPEFWPWALDFLLAHPRDITAEPYAGGLPASFPDYCEIAE